MTTGVLPFDNLKKQCQLNTGFFETSQYTENTQMAVVSGNHDDAGLSIGNLQYNFGPADRAQEWFKYMIDNHVTVVNNAFLTNTTELATFKNVINTYTRAQRITWGDSISVLINGEKRGMAEPYKSAFATMLISAEGKVKYYAMRDTYYWTPIYEVFRHLSCTSRISLASLFDTYINKGRYYPINALVAKFDAIDANDAIDATEKERQKNYQINWQGNYNNAVKDTENAWGGIDQVTFWHGDGVDDGRRGCMANQEGVYYGANYDPDVQFDMNQEPATDEKVGGDPINVKLGNVEVNNIFLGNTPVLKLYLGATLLGGGEIAPVTSSRVPVTQFRTNPGSYAGIANQSQVSLTAGQPLWIDVQEPFVGCRTYYTTNGSEPTTASALYDNALTFDASLTLKVKTISVFDVASATKTLAVTVTGGAGVTSVSPTATTQNTIPFNVTLTNSLGNTIYYKVGAGTQQTYSAPFPVSQTTNNVGVNILVTYWSTGEAEKTITYNTAGALTGAPVVTATPGNWYVRLDWSPSTNATSYSVYRSTVSGQLGTLISDPYQAGVGFDDNTAQNDITYYYTVRSANYGDTTDGVQVSAKPTSVVAPTSYRYVRYTGYGDSTSATTSRLVEIQAMHGATNRLLNKLPLAGYATVNGGAIAVATDGAFVQSTGYPLWWQGAGIPVLVYDMLDWYAIDTIKIAGYSKSTDQRATKFKIDVSVDNVAWVPVVDYSANATIQPETGFSFPVT